MPSPSDFKTRFPEFDSIDDPRVQVFLDDAALIVSANFRDYQDVATLYLAAHFLALSESTSSGDSSSTAPVSSDGVDGVSTSYAVAQVESSHEQYLTSTQYGQRYIMYKKKIAVANVAIV